MDVTFPVLTTTLLQYRRIPFRPHRNLRIERLGDYLKMAKCGYIRFLKSSKQRSRKCIGEP